MNAIAFCIDGNLFIGKIIPQADGSESQGWKCIAQLYGIAVIAVDRIRIGSFICSSSGANFMAMVSIFGGPVQIPV